MKKKEQIKLVLDEFDFKKVQSVMNFLNWKWKFENGSRVPSYQELEHNAKLQLEKVADANEENAIFELGGFEASKQDGVLQLRFILESSNPLGSLLNK
jgi:hypothetical protein